MAAYDISTFGRVIVVNEPDSEFSSFRIIFIMIIILVGLWLKFKEGLVFWSIWLNRQINRFRISDYLYIVYTVNSVIHIVLCVDSMARPVDYHEPKFVYQKYILSTMELSFYFNIPVILIGYYGLTRLLLSLAKGDPDVIRRKCRLILFYVIFSMCTLLHYRQEPPHSYSVWINLIIICEAISALILSIIITLISYLNYKKYFKNTNQDLNDLIHINYANSDDEDIETYNKDKVQRARQRSRSRSPTRQTEL